MASVHFEKGLKRGVWVDCAHFYLLHVELIIQKRRKCAQSTLTRNANSCKPSCHTSKYTRHLPAFTQQLSRSSRKMLLIATALTSVLFMQLYSNNLLLSIVRPVTEKTPNTFEEVIWAVEKGMLSHQQHECIHTIEDDLRLAFAKHNGFIERALLSQDATNSSL